MEILNKVPPNFTYIKYKEGKKYHQIFVLFEDDIRTGATGSIPVTVQLLGTPG